MKCRTWIYKLQELIESSLNKFNVFFFISNNIFKHFFIFFSSSFIVQMPIKDFQSVLGILCIPSFSCH